MEAMQEFEREATCDLNLTLYPDGSGHVMVPEAGTSPEGEGAWEEVFRFESIEQLGVYLEAGELLPPAHCEECGHEQPDMGNGVACEECGAMMPGRTA